MNGKHAFPILTFNGKVVIFFFWIISLKTLLSDFLQEEIDIVIDT